jgi:hypothetical protein
MTTAGVRWYEVDRLAHQAGLLEIKLVTLDRLNEL